MKVLITILIGLLVVGCGKSDAERRKEEREYLLEKKKRDIEKLGKAYKAIKDLNDAKREK